jgi:FLVCR family feline leukemia virus subgroup C receptor-related protein
LIHLDGDDIQQLLLIYAGISTVPTILLIFWFEDKPPTPPSASTALALNRPHQGFKEATKQLFLEKYYALVWLCYGVLGGCYFAFIAVLEQIGYAANYSAVSTY